MMNQMNGHVRSSGSLAGGAAPARPSAPARIALAAAALLVACLVVLFAGARPAWAVVNLGQMSVFAPGYVQVTEGESAALSCVPDPASSEQTPNCASWYCPTLCDQIDENGVAHGGGCLNDRGQCTCFGSTYSTYYAWVTVSSDNPGVARASWADGVLYVTGYAPGTANIVATAQMNLFTPGTTAIAVEVAAAPEPEPEPVVVDGGGSGDGAGDGAGAGEGAGDGAGAGEDAGASAVAAEASGSAGASAEQVATASSPYQSVSVGTGESAANATATPVAAASGEGAATDASEGDAADGDASGDQADAGSKDSASVKTINKAYAAEGAGEEPDPVQGGISPLLVLIAIVSVAVVAFGGARFFMRFKRNIEPLAVTADDGASSDEGDGADER